MNTENPYAAPRATANATHGPMPIGTGYVPLGWRTILTTIVIASAAAFGIAFHTMQIAFAEKLTGAHPDRAASLLLALSGAGLVGATVAGAVFYGIWLHRAARNLRGLERIGMVHSPARCVGSFYVPFVNLVRPFRAVTEVWRASEPGSKSDGRGWVTFGSSTPLVGLWWGS